MLVLLNNPTKMLGTSPKLTIFWEELPYKIIEMVNDVTARIQRVGHQKQRVVHVDRMKKVEKQPSVDDEGDGIECIEMHDASENTAKLQNDAQDASCEIRPGNEHERDESNFMDGIHWTILQEMGLKEKEEKKVIHTRYGRPSKPPGLDLRTQDLTSWTMSGVQAMEPVLDLADHIVDWWETRLGYQDDGPRSPSPSPSPSSVNQSPMDTEDEDIIVISDTEVQRELADQWKDIEDWEVL